MTTDDPFLIDEEGGDGPGLPDSHESSCGRRARSLEALERAKARRARSRASERALYATGTGRWFAPQGRGLSFERPAPPIAPVPNPRERVLLSVTEALERCRGALEGVLEGLWIGGEVSDVYRSAAGHVYFRIKDETGVLSCVLFSFAFARNPAQFRSGDRIEVRGRADVYTRGGDLQLRVEAWRRAGLGALYEAYLRLRAKLEAEGLFDAARKRPIPAFVRSVAIVTSPQAAALQDVLRTLARRTPWVRVTVVEASVQGEGSPAELVAALRVADGLGCDVVLLVRGGGSLEDLQSFNDESVARALAALKTPAITGVGHETDVTIVDAVADLRASTPTAAAESIGPDLAHWRLRLSRAREVLERAWLRLDEGASLRLDRVERYLGAPGVEFRRSAGALERASLAFERVFALSMAERGRRVIVLERTLCAPEALLAAYRQRAGRAAQKLDAAAVGLAEMLSERVEHAGGLVLGSARARIEAAALRFARAERLVPEPERLLSGAAARLSGLERALKALDPDRPLSAGWARLEDESGRPADAEKLTAGSRVRLRFARVAAEATIERIVSVDSSLPGDPEP